MSEGAKFSVGALCVAAVLLGLISASLYGCQQQSKRYYDYARRCTEAGGSFLPYGGTSDIGLCIAPRGARS